MAVRKIETTGHESVDAVSNAETGSLTAGHIVGVLYDDAKGTAELSAALELCQAQLLQQEG
jgi:hypothetical protein